MEVKQENFELIEGFTKCCNEIIDGKFILADMKIANLFKFIDGQEELCDLFARAMQNFNFDKEFTKCKLTNDTMGHFFRLPEDNVKIIAIIYNILQDANTNKMDLYGFINTYFSDETDAKTNSAYANFCLKIIVPFRDTVVSALQDKFEIAPMEKNLQIDLDASMELDAFSRLELIIEQILQTVKYEPKIKKDKKEELEIVLKGLKQASNMHSLSLIGAIAIGLDYIIKNVKSARLYYAELQDCLNELY